MSEHNEADCEFCQLSKILEEALASNDIEVVRKAVVKFSDLWACTDFDLSHDEAILDGSWPQAEEILTRCLEKAKHHPNREVDSLNKAREFSKITYICPICKRDLGSAMNILGDKAGVLALHNKMHMTEIELRIWITLDIHKKELSEELQQMVDERNETRRKLFGVGK